MKKGNAGEEAHVDFVLSVLEVEGVDVIDVLVDEVVGVETEDELLEGREELLVLG